MSDGVRGVVVGHGRVAEALVEAAEEISGLHGVLFAVTNTGADRAQLEQRVVDAVGDQPSVVFVDLPSGSCHFAAMRRLARREDVRVVTGVNLVMLLEFLFHRELSPAEVAHRVAETGTKGISER